MTTENALVGLTLSWHGMACPACLKDHTLVVSFLGTARLTAEGSEDIGAHEWGETSHCTCKSCDFSSVAAAFQFGDEDETVVIPVTAHDEVIDERIEDPCSADFDVTYSFDFETTSVEGGIEAKVVRTIGSKDLEGRLVSVIAREVLPTAEALQVYTLQMQKQFGKHLNIA